ncbi:hypothetical protein SUGI_0300500 [Cryptomeria japonica]|uniref:protein LEAD-SENSITIVE 1-like n=1 Tax=Cryptomeria japonica TaxID=3369 RepID=UPI002408EBB9|nr:protein LEAD-SENSITIVE 1-like [Cryptomeria japonica]GLJ17307.1 hypothetical protein SUGI_0300500 [Cryptomeria japonica]
MGNAPATPSKYCWPIHVSPLSRSEILPWDHIYTWSGTYQRHGIYIGEELVIHFQNSLEGTILASSTHPFCPCSVCGYPGGMSGVVLTCLDCFVGKGDIYRHEYGVKPGLSRSATCDPPEIVIRRARDLLKDLFGTYNLFRSNCEHFAIFCKTGRYMPASQGGQVDWALDLLTPQSSFQSF